MENEEKKEKKHAPRRLWRARTPLMKYTITYGPEDEDCFQLTAPNGVKSDVFPIDGDGVSLVRLDGKVLIVVTNNHDKGDGLKNDAVYTLGPVNTGTAQDPKLELDDDDLEDDDEDSDDSDDADDDDSDDKDDLA